MLVACGEKKNFEVLPSDKLEAVLYDYHLAQVMVKDLPANERYKKDLYFAYVYDKHGVTKENVDSTLAYYSRYPEGLADIYANLATRLEADIKRLAEENKPLKVRESVAVVGDSVDLWYDVRFVEMNASPSSAFCFSSKELNPPMVSFSSPAMDPLRSRINTTSVKPFFMIDSSLVLMSLL
jgi:hypothetical protein